jgi:hypothetical protein
VVREENRGSIKLFSPKKPVGKKLIGSPPIFTPTNKKQGQEEKSMDDVLFIFSFGLVAGLCVAALLFSVLDPFAAGFCKSKNLQSTLLSDNRTTITCKDSTGQLFRFDLSTQLKVIECNGSIDCNGKIK